MQDVLQVAVEGLLYSNVHTEDNGKVVVLDWKS